MTNAHLASSPPRVLAVMVVHRLHPDTTDAALGSLAASTGVDLSVVVVFNGSGDDWPTVERRAAVAGAQALRRTRNRGFADAVNEGLRRAQPDQHVFLLNDDATVAPDTILRCVEALDEAGEQCISVCPMVVHASSPDRVDSMGVVLRPDGEGFNAFQGRHVADPALVAQPLLGPSFAAALFRAGAFTDDRVGPLSTNYFLYFEDVEWNIRARHRGFESRAVPTAIAHHHHSLTTRTLGEGRRFALVQRNRLLHAVAVLSWRGVARVARAWLLAHAKGFITGPYRLHRVRLIAAAVVRLPIAIRHRRRFRGRQPVSDEALMAFSTGHSPSFDATTYRVLPATPRGQDAGGDHD